MRCAVAEPGSATQMTAVADKPDNMETKDTTHRASIEELLKAGTHFGHLTSRWNPKMRPYVFMERNGIHIIDLTQTQKLLDDAAAAAARFAAQGKAILFAGTKKQARDILRKYANECTMPYVVERWLGGTLTNFQTIRRSIRRMEDLAKMEEDGTLEQLKKKERLMKFREHQKLEKVLAGISNMARLPGALFVVDINREKIAVQEAIKLNIPIIAMVDTNCDPDLVDFPIPSNDDAIKSIELVASVVSRAIQEGTKQRDLKKATEKAEKEKIAQEKAAEKAEKARAAQEKAAKAKTEKAGAEKEQKTESAEEEEPSAEVQEATEEAAGEEKKTVAKKKRAKRATKAKAAGDTAGETKTEGAAAE